jgi:hypothetical protein
MAQRYLDAQPLDNLWAGRRKNISFADESIKCGITTHIVPSQSLSEILAMAGPLCDSGSFERRPGTP